MYVKIYFSEWKENMCGQLSCILTFNHTVRKISLTFAWGRVAIRDGALTLHQRCHVSLLPLYKFLKAQRNQGKMLKYCSFEALTSPRHRHQRHQRRWLFANRNESHYLWMVTLVTVTLVTLSEKITDVKFKNNILYNNIFIFEVVSLP